MTRYDSQTRRHILNVTEHFLDSHQSPELRIADIAKLADVGVPTVYYYFISRVQLVAEAQSLTYFKLIEPLHELLHDAEDSLLADDELMFLAAVGNNVAAAWSHSGEDGWKIMRMLMDVWADTRTRHEFCRRLDLQLGRWIILMNEAKSLGWVGDSVDVSSLIASCWAGSMGQVIFSESSVLGYSASGIRDFYLTVVSGKKQ